MAWTGSTRCRWLALVVTIVAVSSGCVRREAEGVAETRPVAKPSETAPKETGKGSQPATPPAQSAEEKGQPTTASASPKDTVAIASGEGSPGLAEPAGLPANPVVRSAAPAAERDDGLGGMAPPAYVFSPERTVAAGSARRTDGSVPDKDDVGIPEPDSPASGSPTSPPTSVPLEPTDQPPVAKRGGEIADKPVGQVAMSIVPSAIEIVTGDVISVDVMASSSAAIADAPFRLRFNPTVLGYVDATPGDFLAQSGSSVVFLADGGSRPGDVAIGVGRVERAAGATGVGLLCRVRLRAVGVGVSSLSFGEALAWDTSNRAVPVTAVGSAVSVR